MSKLIIVFLLISAPNLSYSKILFKCQFRSPDYNETYDVLAHKIGGGYSMTLNKAHFPILKVINSKLSKIGNLLKCDKDPNGYKVCSRKYFGKKGKKWENRVIHNEVEILRDYIDEFNIAFGFKIKDIYRGRKYTLDRHSRYGTLGLTEFFNKSGRLLGRVFFNIEPMECL